MRYLLSEVPVSRLDDLVSLSKNRVKRLSCSHIDIRVLAQEENADVS